MGGKSRKWYPSSSTNRTATSVTASTPVTISATWNGVTQSATLTVNPAAVSFSLTSDHSSIEGGGGATGAIWMSSAAPSSGATFSLTSSNPNVLQVPSMVTVAGGSSDVYFSISTSPVSQNTPVTITASSEGASVSITVSVTGSGAPAVSFNLTSDNSSIEGGGGATGAIWTSSPAPSGGSTFSLTSSNPNVVQVPSTVTVAGGSSHVYFGIGTSPVSQDTPVTITASSGGASSSITITVEP